MPRPFGARRTIPMVFSMLKYFHTTGTFEDESSWWKWFWSEAVVGFDQDRSDFDHPSKRMPPCTAFRLLI